MKAILMRAPGSPEVLEMDDVPLPKIADAHQMIVRLHAAGLNPLDTKVRKLHFMYPDHLPVILGCDGAGIVEHVGEAVTRFKPGDEVYSSMAAWDAKLGRMPNTR